MKREYNLHVTFQILLVNDSSLYFIYLHLTVFFLLCIKFEMLLILFKRKSSSFVNLLKVGKINSHILASF